MADEKKYYAKNAVSVEGNVTGDAELRHGQNGTVFCNFRIAVARGKTTAFVDVTAFDKIAESHVVSLKKGRRIFLHNVQLHQDEWDDKTSGEKRSKLCLQLGPGSSILYLEKAGGDRPQGQASPEADQSGY